MLKILIELNQSAEGFLGEFVADLLGAVAIWTMLVFGLWDPTTFFG